MKLSNSLKLVLSFIALLGSISGVVILQKSSLSQLKNLQSNEKHFEEQESFLVDAQLQKKLPSFGFNNLLADLTFFKFIQYFGDDEARKVTGYSIVTNYFEDIVNRDPNFIQSHLVMSAANSLFAGKPEQTVNLINQALEEVDPQAPNYPFLLWTYKAVDEILFLGDVNSAKNSYEIAAKWARQNEDNLELGNEMAGRYDKTAEYLASNPDPTQAQFGAWMNILYSTKDGKTQQHVLNQIQELGAEVNIFPDGRFEIKPPKLNSAQNS